jgi:hypothetical protein
MEDSIIPPFHLLSTTEVIREMRPTLRLARRFAKTDAEARILLRSYRSRDHRLRKCRHQVKVTKGRVGMFSFILKRYTRQLKSAGQAEQRFKQSAIDLYLAITLAEALSQPIPS